MTTAQWLFEYIALREKEKDQLDLIKLGFKTFRKMMIQLLGMDLIPKDAEMTKGMTEEELDEIFIPFSIIAGRREVVETILKGFNNDENHATEDEDFERISAAMANNEDLGDMGPLYEISKETEIDLNKWFTPGKEAELARLGVKIGDDTSKKPSVNIDMDTDKNVQYDIEEAMNNKLEDLEREAEPTQRGVKVIFDDNG